MARTLKNKMAKNIKTKKHNPNTNKVIEWTFDFLNRCKNDDAIIVITDSEIYDETPLYAAAVKIIEQKFKEFRKGSIDTIIGASEDNQGNYTIAALFLDKKTPYSIFFTNIPKDKLTEISKLAEKHLLEFQFATRDLRTCA